MLFADELSRTGGKVALFSAWPTAGRRVDFPRAIESYRLAATDVNGVFLPVADAWIAAWARNPSLTLYASDGLHASTNGAYLTAITIFARLARRSPIGLPSRVRTAGGITIEIDSVTARQLQEAAEQATK